MSTMTPAPIDAVSDPGPRAATGKGSLLGAELGRLRRRRLVITLVVLAFVGLVVAMAALFVTHSTDIAGARADAAAMAQEQAAANREFEAQCLQDPGMPQADKDAGACSAGGTAADFYQDPRFFADQGLPTIALGVGVAGALVMALIGATAVGADWSSRAIITLITWEPRRLRLIGTRLAAIGIVGAVLGVVAQALALGLGALVVQLRGTWAATPPPPADGAYYYSQPLIGQAHFWRDLVSTQARGVVLMILVAVLAAAITTVARHTAGLLGIFFAWFAVVENVVRAVGSDRGWPRWLLTENVVAFLVPGGQHMQVGTRVTANGPEPREVLVSNLDALLYLGIITVVVALLAGLLLRRRDL